MNKNEQIAEKIEKIGNNTFKKFLTEVHFNSSGFLVQLYGDWKEGSGHTDVYTYMGLLGFESKKFKVGALYAGQIRQVEPDSQVSVEITSGFSTFHLNKYMTIILRYDKMFAPSPAGISYIPFAQAKSNLLIGGIDLRVNESVHFIPNIEYVFYDDTDGYKPSSDLYLRGTFYVKF